MSDQSQITQRVDFPPVFILGDKPHDSSDVASSGIDSNVRSRNIEFDPVEIVGTPPQVIEMPPLEVTIPKPDTHSKESAASPDSRATLSEPSSENNSQKMTPNEAIAQTSDESAISETPNMETPKSETDFSTRRQSWADAPFDDYTAGGRLPSFVYPNKPDIAKKPKRKKTKKRKTTKVSFDPILIIVKRQKPQTEEIKKRQIDTQTAEDKLEEAGGLIALQSENLYFPGAGYYYRFEWEIGDISEGDTAEKAMKILQRDPDSIFPFGVEGGIREGNRVNLRNPRFFFIPGLTTALQYYGLSKNHVIVQKVSPTSFTFRTESDHFDGADGLITFTTIERDGKVFLVQSAYAPTAGIPNSIVAPPGAWFGWNYQQAQLEAKLIEARKNK